MKVPLWHLSYRSWPSRSFDRREMPEPSQWSGRLQIRDENELATRRPASDQKKGRPSVNSTSGRPTFIDCPRNMSSDGSTTFRSNQGVSGGLLPDFFTSVSRVIKVDPI